MQRWGIRRHTGNSPHQGLLLSNMILWPSLSCSPWLGCTGEERLQPQHPPLSGHGGGGGGGETEREVQVLRAAGRLRPQAFPGDPGPDGAGPVQWPGQYHFLHCSHLPGTERRDRREGLQSFISLTKSLNNYELSIYALFNKRIFYFILFFLLFLGGEESVRVYAARTEGWK